MPLSRYRMDERTCLQEVHYAMTPEDNTIRRARVIAVGNQKGGVGKTTNTVHIARALAELGRRVLIIDLDMNHGATRHFGVEPEAFFGSFEMLVGDEPAENLVISYAEKEE